jgi:nucleoside-diphosphate-sugar epimerase
MDSKSYAIPDGSKILVTGANGYIASHVCDILLGMGYQVRGTLRSEKPWLNSFFEKKYGTGRFESMIIPSLVEVEPWEAAAAGVHGIAHVVSQPGYELMIYNHYLAY